MFPHISIGILSSPKTISFVNWIEFMKAVAAVSQHIYGLNFFLIVQMSQLIRSRKAVMTTHRSIPLPPTSAATAPAKMNRRPVDPVGPRVSQAPASSTSSMALPVSARRGHRRPRTPDTTSTFTTDASGSQQGRVK